MAQKTKAVDQESAKECIECDAAIPEGRRQAIKGCQLCVNCQAKKE
ncbi:TPA: TraR/DksA C4-type zinc finger protein [Vibrio antiquarius]